MQRRDVLVFGGLAALALAIPPYLRRRSEDFVFEPLAGFDGFRRLDRGPITAGLGVFAGLSPPPEPLQVPTGPLCHVLFGDMAGDGSLPVAVFGDVNCRNCAAFEARLDRVGENDPPLRVFHHQLPLLGPRSVWAARVILAAKLQDPTAKVYGDLLRRVLRPGPAGTRAVAERHDLNPERLFADAQGPVVADQLGKALGLGAALGIPGTPASVIGRTLVIGALPEHDLARLIALERADAAPTC